MGLRFVGRLQSTQSVATGGVISLPPMQPVGGSGSRTWLLALRSAAVGDWQLTVSFSIPIESGGRVDIATLAVANGAQGIGRFNLLSGYAADCQATPTPSHVQFTTSGVFGSWVIDADLYEVSGAESAG